MRNGLRADIANDTYGLEIACSQRKCISITRQLNWFIRAITPMIETAIKALERDRD